MTRAVAGLLWGFDYQARHFWIEGLRLLRTVPVLERVAIEATSPRGFDDVVSYPVMARDQDVYGRPVGLDGFQAKYHVDHSTAITTADLADPGFIGTKTSLLERLKAAVETAEAASLIGRFTLVTPWQVDRSDLLSKLVGPDGELRLSALFDAGGDRSATGRVRKTWREHLGLRSDQELRQLLSHLRVLERDMVVTDRELERELDSAGLERVREGSVMHPYVDLINGHLKRNETVFTAEGLRKSLTAAQLWRRRPTEPPQGRAMAIRSRRRGVVHLEDEATELLDLIPLFHDRALGDGIDWDSDVAARIDAFLAAKLEPGQKYVLYLDAHGAIAFAAGWLLHRSDVTVMQATGGHLVPWPVDGGSIPNGSLWHAREEPMGSAGPDVALALSVTHNIEHDVLAHVASSLPSVGRAIALAVPAPGHAAVQGGAHAAALASEAVQLARRLRPRDGRPSRVHVFAAAPNGLLFQLGRTSRALGQTTVYEFDFEEQYRGYAPAITFPMEDAHDRNA